MAEAEAGPGPLPPTGYPAGVARPAVGFSLEVPDHWVVLDLDPTTRDRWVDAFLVSRVDDGRQRPAARRALLELLGQLERSQVFMAAILCADVAGDLVSASATLAWRQLQPGGGTIPVDGLVGALRQGPASGQVEVAPLQAGPAARVASREFVSVPGASAGPRPVATVQYLVPVADTGWLAVITTSTAQRELEDGVAAVAAGMAQSLEFSPGPGG